MVDAKNIVLERERFTCSPHRESIQEKSSWSLYVMDQNCNTLKTVAPGSLCLLPGEYKTFLVNLSVDFMHKTKVCI